MSLRTAKHEAQKKISALYEKPKRAAKKTDGAEKKKASPKKRSPAKGKAKKGGSAKKAKKEAAPAAEKAE